MTSSDNMIDDTDKREKERVAPVHQLLGAVMVFQPMTIIEISHNGAQIETPFRLQLDSLHDFRLALGDRFIVIKGRVAHCSISDVEQEVVFYRSGIEFVEPGERVFNAIRDFIESIKEGRRSV